MDKFRGFIEQLDDMAISLIIAAVCIVLALLFKYGIFYLLSLYNRRSNPELVKSVNRHLNQPFAYFIPLLFIAMALPAMPLSVDQAYTVRRILEILSIIVFAWILIKVVAVIQERVRQKYAIDKSDNFRERKLITQLQFVRRISIILIVFFAVSLVLLQFDAVRTLGTGLLTSAGIAGVVLGFAAQRSLANLLAGLQIAFTQPIRIDDVLVIENEFGRVEEITLTYIVLRLWDNRRLILPLNYLIEKPFQNWTRSSTEILATVFIYTDYNVPVESIRQELRTILSGSGLWNGEVWGLQVTEVLQDTVQLRALFSAHNSGEAWDLRCLVREKLLYFIQTKYPEALPKVRATISGESGLK